MLYHTTIYPKQPKLRNEVMLLDEEGEVLTDTDNISMQMGCNKIVNVDNDLRYSDFGVQSIDDSPDPQLPTAMFIVGLSRTITFEQMQRFFRREM